VVLFALSPPARVGGQAPRRFVWENEDYFVREIVSRPTALTREQVLTAADHGRLQ
jgi:hypothetical protein